MRESTETVSAPLNEQELTLQAALTAQPEDAETNYRMGLNLSITAPEAASQYFEAALSAAPSLEAQIERVTEALRLGELSDNPAYRLTLLGQAFGALQEWELALQALEQAVEEAPGYAEAWAYLGEAQHHNEMDGYRALDTALSLDPDSYSANLLMALYLRRSEAPNEALEYLMVAAQQDPNNLSLQEEIANTYAQAGDVEQGLAVLEENADTSPDQSEVWQMLASYCLNYDIKLDELGLPAARQALLLDDEDPTNHLLLGRAYLQGGDTAMAERFLRQAIELDPQYAEAYFYLGLLYLNQGDMQAAEDYLSQAYQLAPTEAVGLQAQQIIEQYFGN